MAVQEEHHTVKELASLWRLSYETTRRLFKNEPGVITISNQKKNGKRIFVSYRIPSSVAQRVYRRLTGAFA